MSRYVTDGWVPGNIPVASFAYQYCLDEFCTMPGHLSVSGCSTLKRVSLGFLEGRLFRVDASSHCDTGRPILWFIHENLPYSQGGSLRTLLAGLLT